VSPEPGTEPPPAPPAPTPRAKASFGRRLLTAYARPGDLARWCLVLLGALLDLLWLSPMPFGFRLPWLVLLADVPFLLLLWHRDGARWKRWVFLYALVHFAVGFPWLTEVGVFQWAGAVVGLTPIYLFLGAALRWGARHRLPFVPLVGVCIVLEEWSRTVWMGGMPWPQRSLAFVDVATLRASVALAGAYGLSFLAGMTSALACGLVGVFRAHPDVRPLIALRAFGAGLVPALWTLLLIAHGAGRMGHLRGALADGTCAITPRLLLVQADIPQSLKHAPKDQGDLLNRIFRKHLALTRAGLDAAAQEGTVVLGVLWPETMIPWPFTTPRLAHRFPAEWANQNVIVREMRNAVPPGLQAPPFFVGAIHHFESAPDEAHESVQDYGDHDSLFWIDPTHPFVGAPEPPPPETRLLPWERGRHDKVVRVPGGEYTPLGDLLPPLRVFRDSLSQIPEIAAGAEDQEPFEIWDVRRLDESGRPRIRPVRAGTVICFEIAFPSRCRAWRRQGCGVLFNAANYGWFGETPFREQIRAVGALRAAELGITVVMAGNTGPTVFFDPVGAAYGDFHPETLDKEGLLVPGAPAPSPGPPGGDPTTFRTGWVLDHLYADDTLTLYAGWGDTPWFVLAGLFVVLGLWDARRRRSRPTYPQPQDLA
jgi:apolipoprotein N-acyltransferase